MNKITNVIAVDGPVASGKGEVTRLVSQQLGLLLLDTGIFYRVAAYIWKDGFDPNRISWESERICLDGIPVTDKMIRTPEIDNLTPIVASNPDVRKALIPLQRRCIPERGAIVDGRDMGSVVFPDARLKIFLTASPLIRMERRCLQYEKKGVVVSRDEILESLNRRDLLDNTRAESPLIKAPDAHEINSDYLSQSQAADIIIGLWYRTAA